jgi:predicted Zn-dependent protease
MTDYRLRAEIIRVRDEAQLWVEDFQIPQAHWAGLELGLAERLAFRLGMVFEPASLDLAASADPVGPTARLEAWERFQRGHQDLYSAQRPQLQESLQNLLRATELDPSLLQAQIDLIQLCLKESVFGFLSPAIAAEQVRRASRAIPRTDPAAVTVLPAIGWLRFYVDRNLSGAVHAFEESSQLPHDAWTTRWRVAFALSRGQWQLAVSIIESALRQDPYASWLHGTLAWCWHLARQPEKSLAQIERTLTQFDPDEGFGLYAVVILAYNDRAEEAVALAERLARALPDCDLCTSVHAYALACAGRRKDAVQMVERLQWLGRERYVPAALLSATFMALGNSEAAIQQLRIAEEARCPWFFQMLTDPRLDDLHDHPEFLRMQASLSVMEASLNAESPLRREQGFARLHEVKR